VGGGQLNTSSAQYATVGGGIVNTASGDSATVAGGIANTASGDFAAIGGGEGNEARNGWDTVAGGNGNIAQGQWSAVGGGQANDASGGSSTVSGGIGNTAAGSYSMVPGGRGNFAGGDWSLAAGRTAQANFNGQSVWADSQPFNFPAAGEGNFTPAANQFLVRATGNPPGTIDAVVFTTAVNAAGQSLAGVKLTVGGGAWLFFSDRDSKEHFRPAGGRDVLDRLNRIPISTWNYKAQGSGVRHIGPIAQDFYAAFGLGEEERFINAMDLDGVALAAIQGLHEIVLEKDACITELQEAHDAEQERIAELEARLAAIEALIEQQLPANKGGAR
jgi:hypothetical protein